MKGARIILGVTGSIAAFKAADLTARLVNDGVEVVVIMTDAAQKFVAPLTFETLSRRPVVTSLWTRADVIEPAHVELADWGDLLVVAPASANFIGKLANGIADDMLSCTAITIKSPPLIAPAMNVNMWRHPAVQSNVEKLRERGCTFVGPVEGRLASGLVAMGRMAEIEDIVAGIRQRLSKPRTTMGSRR
jgi:phosphopantothenoylcysteine synthetase/decarboxylase